MTTDIIEFLQLRRSVVAKKMISEAPSEQHLESILACGLRVPDHSNVQPWRITVFKNDARERFARQVILPAARTRATEKNQELSASQAQIEEARMLRGGVVIAVLSKPVIPHKIPVWEQQLSAGAVCCHMLIAAQSLDYAAQWISEWPAYDHDVIRALGGDPASDLIAGFIHIGKKSESPTERSRPASEEIINFW